MPTMWRHTFLISVIKYGLILRMQRPLYLKVVIKLELKINWLNAKKCINHQVL